MIKATLGLRGVNCWAEHAAEKWKATINVHSCRPQNDSRSVQNWVEILTDDKNIAPITKQISDQVISSEIVRLMEGRAFGLVVTQRCPASEAMRDLTCVITSHKVETNGFVELEVLVSGKDTLKQLTDRFLRKGIEVKVLRLTSMIGGEKMTAKQEQVIHKALEMGFYDCPRRIRQKDLAKLCGISSSTLSELLRRAERNMIEAHTASHDIF